MDPLWMMLADTWWVAPVAAGAGTVGWVGVRGARTSGARRLELHAAQHDVRAARTALTRGRAEIAVANAELARAQADRSAFQASERDVAAARRALQDARQTVRATALSLRARRASLRAARATVPRAGAHPDEYPLTRLIRAHNAVLARWIDYETDAAKLFAFPAMSDGRSPVLAPFLREQAIAQELRPYSAQSRVTPAEFAAYRDAVRRVERAFDAAENEVRRGGSRSVPLDAGSRWSDTAQDLLATAQRAVAWSADAMARASDASSARGKPAWATSPRRPKPPPSSS